MHNRLEIPITETIKTKKKKIEENWKIIQPLTKTDERRALIMNFIIFDAGFEGNPYYVQ